ncbi:MAG: hypothetical protein ABL940_08450, partial [Bacteroidia bacterium]
MTACIGGQNILQTIRDSIDAKAWLIKGNNSTATSKLGTLNAQDLHIVTGGTDKITILNGTGNVGIGQTLPAAKLDVLGNVQFFGDLKPGGLPGVAGQYLTSAGLGVAPTWTSISIPATTVSNTLTGTNLTTTVNGVTGAPIDLSTIAPATTVSNTYNSTTGALSTTVNGVTGADVIVSTANSITDSIKAQAWLLKGNAGTVAGTNFIGTTDNVDVVFKRSGVQSGLLGSNTSFGVSALNPFNTGFGNTAVGANSMSSNTTGFQNTALGTGTAAVNTTGYSNTAVGFATLQVNTADVNTGVGSYALNLNSTGSSNTATGASALGKNTTASANTANGFFSLEENTTGGSNTAVGSSSLVFNTVGAGNTAVGASTGGSNTMGTNNMFLGYSADATANNLTNATAIGYNAKVSASNAMVLGGTGVDAVNVGINTTTPNSAYRLHIVDKAIKIDGNSNVVGNNAYVEFGYNNGTPLGFVGDGSTGDDDNYLWSIANGVRIGSGAIVTAPKSMIITNTGNVGIGTFIPAQKLDVVGNLQFTQALMPNASAGTAGQLLASAGAGVAPTWIN